MLNRVAASGTGGSVRRSRYALLAIKTTETTQALAHEGLEEEIATIAAHINAATARWLELVSEFQRQGGAAIDGFERWLAFRCGISPREAREYVRVADALQDLPAMRAAFSRGELSFSKVRALSRVATPRSEQGLLDLASALTASQLDRALRVYRRVSSQEAGETHALEYLDYYWAEDGSLVLRARLPAEEGTVLVRALEAARERVREWQSEDRGSEQGAREFEPARSPQVEALVELAKTSLGRHEHEPAALDSRIVVHVDAAALVADGAGRCELEGGPVISPETARRLACDAESVSAIEREGLPLSVGRRRRSVPPKLRRLLEARDDGCCRWPGCTRRHLLHAHHREHWAKGGETSLANLVLLCWHHHRLVHEGGYTIEDSPHGELRFRNRHGVLAPTVPRSPPGSAEELVDQNRREGLTIGARTNHNGYGERLDLELAVAAVERALA